MKKNPKTKNRISKKIPLLHKLPVCLCSSHQEDLQMQLEWQSTVSSVRTVRTVSTVSTVSTVKSHPQMQATKPEGSVLQCHHNISFGPWFSGTHLQLFFFSTLRQNSVKHSEGVDSLPNSGALCFLLTSLVSIGVLDHDEDVILGSSATTFWTI